jgi:hypothetical protein
MWKGCELVFQEGEATKFKEHVNKHGDEQLQLINLNNQRNCGTIVIKGQPMANKTKMDQEKEEEKMTNHKRLNSGPISLKSKMPKILINHFQI